MNVSGEQKLTPQTEEDISEIKWIASEQIDYYLSKAFPLISDIIQCAKKEKFIAA
jgi:hypothetical protein